MSYLCSSNYSCFRKDLNLFSSYVKPSSIENLSVYTSKQPHIVQKRFTIIIMFIIIPSLFIYLFIYLFIIVDIRKVVHGQIVFV